MLKTAGIVEGGPEDWNEYSYGIYVDIEKAENPAKTDLQEEADTRSADE